MGGGTSNIASGAYSFAAGSYAKTQTPDAIPIVHDGAFVWAGAGSFAFHSTAHNEFAVRSTGGVRFATAIDGSGAPTAGVSLAAGDSSWAVLSDRAAKENWVDVDGHYVLDRLVAMPIGWWNYKSQRADVRHIGPTAQDFRSAFGLGGADTTIATIDADGVALAAIQGVYKLVQRKDEEIAALRREIGDLRATQQREMADLRQAVEVLMARTSAEGRVAQAR